MILEAVFEIFTISAALTQTMVRATHLALSVALLLAVAPLPEAEARVRFRCGIFSFFGNDRACRLSCWATDHETGRYSDQTHL